MHSNQSTKCNCFILRSMVPSSMRVIIMAQTGNAKDFSKRCSFAKIRTVRAFQNNSRDVIVHQYFRFLILGGGARPPLSHYTLLYSRGDIDGPPCLFQFQNGAVRPYSSRRVSLQLAALCAPLRARAMGFPRVHSFHRLRILRSRQHRTHHLRFPRR